MTESKLRQLIREEIKGVLQEEREKYVKNPSVFERELTGESIQDATGSFMEHLGTTQYELHFRNGKRLLIQGPDNLIVQEPR